MKKYEKVTEKFLCMRLNGLRSIYRKICQPHNMPKVQYFQKYFYFSFIFFFDFDVFIVLLSELESCIFSCSCNSDIIWIINKLNYFVFEINMRYLNENRKKQQNENENEKKRMKNKYNIMQMQNHMNW